MAFNQFFRRNFSSLKIFRNTFFNKVEGLKKFKYTVYILLILLSFLIFSSIYSLGIKKNKTEKQNFEAVVNSEEFFNFSNFIISKINSPYKEIKYKIQNNDSIEKILKNLKVNSNDIKIISNDLKKQKFSQEKI